MDPDDDRAHRRVVRSVDVGLDLEVADGLERVGLLLQGRRAAWAVPAAQHPTRHKRNRSGQSRPSVISGAAGIWCGGAGRVILIPARGRVNIGGRFLDQRATMQSLSRQRVTI